ncbi:uncharacterized protein IL334_006100 [Kwoniella shivajii]|uniref:Phosphatidylinositol glycan, class S n=1 Tax=Kwoniella shivajii TaxID=564305 RepID=A0ABZ1D4Z2_9TREE|nr:hypothetical protein IL334_006100 [Kwoniella shivajii]
MSITDPNRPSYSNLEREKPTPAEVTLQINPSTKRRLLITLSFPLLFLLAIPFWWYVTSIERLPLPVSRIDTLSNITIPEVRGKILVTADSDAFPTPPPGRAVFETKVILEALGREVVKGVDGIYERSRPQKKRNWDLIYDDNKENPTPFKVHLRRFEHANTSFPLEPYVQPFEKGLMTSGITEGTLVIPVHPKQISDRFLKQHYKIALINSLLSLYPAQPPMIPLRSLKYSPNITLSFVLLNEDSSQGSYARSWSIESAIQDHFIPQLEPLKDIFNFTIESQILYHAPLTFSPTLGEPSSEKCDSARIDAALEGAKRGDEMDEAIAIDLIQESRQQAWWVGEEDMKVFVNSERWSLDSGSTNNPVLRFLLYIPKEAHRPMKLATEDSAQSFLLPQFGSVHILNPPSLSLTQTSTYHLSSSTLKGSFHLFTQHLYSLLALPVLYDPGKIHHPPSPSPLLPPSDMWQGITPWQVNQVLLSRGKENSEEAIKTLIGIKRLVRKIKEMKIGKGVRDKVLGSVERLEQMSENRSALENFISSRDAVTLANEAFFDPSMMGLLYFPDEHKFAVYTPLFAPVAVPLLLGLLKELLSWRKRKRAAAGPAPVLTATATVVEESQEQGMVVQELVNDQSLISEIEQRDDSQTSVATGEEVLGARELRSRIKK